MLASDYTSNSFSITDTLELAYTYYWKIVAKDDKGKTTEGDTWEFNTRDWQCGDGLLYSGQIYATILIDTMCWFAENLNVGDTIWGNRDAQDNGVIEKYCYNNEIDSCDVLGGLYHWDEMMNYSSQESVQGICPSGWHIPGDDEWKILEGTVDSLYPVGDPEWNNGSGRGYDAGKKLKSMFGWHNNGNGTDEYDFTFLPAGGKYALQGLYNNYSNIGRCWTSSKEGSHSAYIRDLEYGDDKIYRWYLEELDHGCSVRCMKD